MKTYKCAHCGKYISQSARDISTRKRINGAYHFGEKAHLCEECAKIPHTWFFEPKERKKHEHE